MRRAPYQRIEHVRNYTSTPVRTVVVNSEAGTR